MHVVEMCRATGNACTPRQFCGAQMPSTTCSSAATMSTFENTCIGLGRCSRPVCKCSDSNIRISYVRDRGPFKWQKHTCRHAAHSTVCFPQARASAADTLKRISESEKRVDTKLGEFVDKKYWCGMIWK